MARSAAPLTEHAAIHEGQTLWWVASSNSREEGEVRVLSIAGEIAHMDNDVALDLRTMNAVPDPISRGRCFPSQEDHQQSLRLISAWADFCRDVAAARLPEGFTEADIQRLRKKLGIDHFTSTRSRRQ